ncbi:MAG: 50S ribosomal protein L4 [Rhodospirillales bacterium]|jgi:large subunit ribosomal protein L4|nr:50S ribosomal protein L4 [Rhodospirillales bacterium]
MKHDVIDLDNKKAGAIELDDAVFAVPVRGDILSRAVDWQLAKRRSGNHKVKQRSEVSGGGHKPFRQKGTGRARQGTSRAPQMRGGGVVFGPAPRDHSIGLPKKVRKLALKTALSAKLSEGKLVVLESAELKSAKTAELAKRIDKLGWRSALVICGDAVDQSFARAASNIANLDVLPGVGANVYDILRRDVLALTRDAVDNLVERLR